MKKGALENFAKIKPVVCGIFNNTIFIEHLWATASGFSLLLTKMGHCQVFGKPQMNTLYLETLNLEVSFRYIISFLPA